jgi:hypothetical protein
MFGGWPELTAATQSSPRLRPSLGACRPMVDWARVASWQAQLVANDLTAIDAVFLAQTGSAPIVVWAPSAEQVNEPPLRCLFDYWSELADGSVLPHHRQIDPLAMRAALGHVMLIDVIEGGHDFRYRLYGSAIARISELDMTGRLMSAHPASSYVAEFALAVSQAVVQRRSPIYTERAPALAAKATRWRRLAFPLVDDAGEVTRLLAATVPLARDGRVISA